MRSVSIRLADLAKATIPVGFAGENLHTQVRIDCLKIFEEYPDALATLTVQPPEGEPYPTIVTRDGDEVVWDVTNSDLIHEGKGELQLSFVEDEIVVKSYVGQYRVLKSILPSGEIPDPIDDWITRAEAALADIPHTINEALEEAKESGEFDGFSPIATVTKEDKVTTISITDVNGTTTASIKDPEYTDLIDDTADAGVLDKTWSADNLVTKLNAKEDIPDLVVTFELVRDGNALTATADKTITEIGEAFFSGKKIKAIAQLEISQDVPKMQIELPGLYVMSGESPDPQGGTVTMYMAIVTGRFFDDYAIDISIVGAPNNTWIVRQAKQITSIDGGNFSAENKKITSLSAPTVSSDAATKGYVDTALSAKEDTPFVVTFDLIIGTDSERFEVVCDKTNAEIISAYESGKTIKAFANIYPDGSANLSVTSELSTIAIMPVGNDIYMMVIGGRIANFMGSNSYSDIRLMAMSVQPSWGIEYFPIYNEIIDDTAGAGTTTFTWSADKLVSEFDLKAPKANPELTGDGLFTGDVYVNCNNDFTGGTKLATVEDVPEVATLQETQAIIDEYETRVGA